MSRRSLTLAFVLLIIALAVGGAVNVYVVYRLARDAYQTMGESSMPRWSHGPGTTAWYWRERTAPGMQRIDAIGSNQRVADGQRAADRVLPPAWTLMTDPPGADDIDQERQELAIGWPYPALAGALVRSRQAFVPGRRGPGWTIIDGKEIPISDPQRIAMMSMTGQIDLMPTRPIWGGFLLNTAFFALPVWVFFLLVAGFIAFGPRRWWRRKRGRCPRCAYDLRRDFARGCPECGWNRSTATSASS